MITRILNHTASRQAAAEMPSQCHGRGKMPSLPVVYGISSFLLTLLSVLLCVIPRHQNPPAETHVRFNQPVMDRIVRDYRRTIYPHGFRGSGPVKLPAKDAASSVDGKAYVTLRNDGSILMFFPTVSQEDGLEGFLYSSDRLNTVALQKDPWIEVPLNNPMFVEQCLSPHWCAVDSFS